MRFADRTYFPDGLNRADLIVGIHNGNNGGLRTDGGFHFFRPDDAVHMHGQQRHFKTFSFQLFQGVEHRVMLKGGGNDMILSLFPSGEGGGTDCLIVRFGSAGSEIYFPRFSVNYGSDILPGLFQYFLCPLADSVKAGRIAVFLPHTSGHGLDGCIAHCGGRGVVRINAHSGKLLCA